MVTQALPPGVEAPAPEVAEEDQAVALGEQASQGVIQPPRVTVQVIPSAAPTEPGQTGRTKGGVVYETLQPGEGKQAVSGETATIHYDLKLEDGTRVQSSRSTNQPYRFLIGGTGGESTAIPGMQEGVAGMKVGEVRRLTIPPELAYGKEGKPGIPANATLIFEVELLKAE
jgi:FKBP-type peptidyl-prolyl cis-trans isomerase